MANEALAKVSGAMQTSSVPGNMANLKSNQVMDILEKMKAQISMALPKHLTPDRMLQMCTTLITRNPRIAKCTTQSIVGAVMQASILGFSPVESLGECYFVPYSNKKNINGNWVYVDECQFQVGYKGYISLARRSDKLKDLMAFVVYKGDTFAYELGLEPNIKHIPALDGDHSKDNIQFVYAVAHFMNGGRAFIVLTKSEVERLRMMNQAVKQGKSSPWDENYARMACAKAIKQLAPYLPLSIDEPMVQGMISDNHVLDISAFSQSGQGLLPENIPTDEEENIDDEPVTKLPEPKEEPKKPTVKEVEAKVKKEVVKAAEVVKAPEPEPVVDEDTGEIDDDENISPYTKFFDKYDIQEDFVKEQFLELPDGDKQKLMNAGFPNGGLAVRMIKKAYDDYMQSIDEEMEAESKAINEPPVKEQSLHPEDTPQPVKRTMKLGGRK